MFHRIGPAAYKPNLDNTIAIAELLNHPENGFSSIHIAGTNGKGSTSHMLAAILQAAGYRTGLYTSPHLLDFRERIRIDGEMIPEKYVVDFVADYKSEFEKIKPSFFEWTVGLAFDYFAKSKIEIAVIETGLGGRLDSTNIITPLVSVITNIGWDHMNLLGDSLQKIAIEKAGIIKREIPVVIGETQPEVSEIFTDRAQELSAPFVFADVNLKVDRLEQNLYSQTFSVFHGDDLWLQNLEVDLPGDYQEKNILTVLQSIRVLRVQGFTISDGSIHSGLKEVKKSTGLMGRWQVISEKPLTICDTGHNVDGIRRAIKQLQRMPKQKLLIVFGMVKDKDIISILNLLPTEAEYFFCAPAIPRALNANELAAIANKINLRGDFFQSVPLAMDAAKKTAREKDVIFIGGSTFVVADALQYHRVF